MLCKAHACTHPSNVIEAFKDVAIEAGPSKSSIKAGSDSPNSSSSLAVPASCELHNIGNISTSTFDCYVVEVFATDVNRLPPA